MAKRRFAALYGEIVPIPAERVLVAEDGLRLRLAGRELELIHTPGHALHHYCIVDRAAGAIFSGDNFGISYRDLDTARGAFIFPTTTPVHFDPQAMHASHRPHHELPARGDLPDALQPRHRAAAPRRRPARMRRRFRRHREAPRRAAGSRARIRADLFEYLSRRLDAHGFAAERGAAPRDRSASDVELNSQGLEVWLDRAA